jgi:hypothetical protein
LSRSQGWPPYLTLERAAPIHLCAQQAVACLSGTVAETLVRDLIAQLRHTQQAEKQMRDVLGDASAALPPSPHLPVSTSPGSGVATAATRIAQAMDMHRCSTPQRFVGYCGVLPQENTSAVDKYGQPLPAGTLRRSRQGNDLVRHYLSARPGAGPTRR